jgi:hypothetical protein
MNVYRGDYSNEWQIEHLKKSRYGMPALFWSNDINVASMYADYHAKSNYLPCGYVYACKLPILPICTVNYNYKYSYGAEFRNLIYSLHRLKHNWVCIKNVLDVPSKEYLSPIVADIYVCFNPGAIGSMELVKSVPNLWL